MRVHVHATCWNEERMLPFFLRHYGRIADRIFVYDDGSTDRSRAILARHGRATIIDIQTTGPSYVESLRALYDMCWHRSRGHADWVIVCNVDEHLDHPAGLAPYLAACRKAGVTAIPTIGHEMVADEFPVTDKRLADVVSFGLRDESLNKLGAFAPSAIHATNSTAGRHVTTLEGNVVVPARRELRLLHFKYLGLEYLRTRYVELASRRRDADIAHGYGYQYSLDPTALLQRFEAFRSAAEEIPPAGHSSAIRLIDHVVSRIAGRWPHVRAAA